MIILNERPPGMPFEEYKAHLRIQKRQTKKRAVPIYISKEKPFFGKLKEHLKQK